MSYTCTNIIYENEKKKVEATLVDFGKIPQLRIRPNSTQNFSIHIDDH
jgi:hypothetical protein